MKLLSLLRWELVQTTRGLAPHAAVITTSLASAGLVASGMLVISKWSPFTPTQSFGFRPPQQSQFMSLVGEHRGDVAFLVILTWVLLIASLVGPAFTAGSIVRDRHSGRLDRLLLDASRSELVAIVKFLVALIPLGLVVATVGPSASFAWLTGGLPTGEAIVQVVILILALGLVCAIGLVASALATTEVTALIVSFLATMTIFWGPILGGIGLFVSGHTAVGESILSFSPTAALFSVESELATSFAHSAPRAWPRPRLAWDIGTLVVPVWLVDALLYAAIAVALVWLTSVLIDPLHPLRTRLTRRPDASDLADNEAVLA